MTTFYDWEADELRLAIMLFTAIVGLAAYLLNRGARAHKVIVTPKVSYSVYDGVTADAPDIIEIEIQNRSDFDVTVLGIELLGKNRIQMPVIDSIGNNFPCRLQARDAKSWYIPLLPAALANASGKVRARLATGRSIVGTSKNYRQICAIADEVLNDKRN